jgi:hypothetical protein
MPRYRDLERLTCREAFALLTVEGLKTHANLIGVVPIKIGDLVDLLARTMGNREVVQSLYNSLDDLGQKAVQWALSHPLCHSSTFPSNLIPGGEFALGKGTV